MLINLSTCAPIHLAHCLSNREALACVLCLLSGLGIQVAKGVGGVGLAFGLLLCPSAKLLPFPFAGDKQVCPHLLPVCCGGLGSRLFQLLFEPCPSVGVVLSARVGVRVHSRVFRNIKKPLG